MVYAADTPALALLETMVHLEDGTLLSNDYSVIPIGMGLDLMEELEAEDLPSDWSRWPWPTTTQSLGTSWFVEQRSAVLRVPSAVVPRQFNYLLNPGHPEFSRLEIGPPELFPVDLRLVDPK